MGCGSVEDISASLQAGNAGMHHASITPETHLPFPSCVAEGQLSYRNKDSPKLQHKGTNTAAQVYTPA